MKFTLSFSRTVLFTCGSAVIAGSVATSSPSRTLEDKSVEVEQLSLQNLRVVSRSVSAESTNTIDAEQTYLVLLNASVAGQEVACLGCDPQLFEKYLVQLKGGAGAVKDAGNGKTDKSLPATLKVQKHPNAPSYQRWEESRNAARSKSFLSARIIPAAQGVSASDSNGFQYHTLSRKNVASLFQHLLELWHDRRLVLGPRGSLPVDRQVDFVSVLADLARESPALTPPDCDLKGLPSCGSLFSGKRTASASKLRQQLDKHFGRSFLNNLEYDPAGTLESNRASLQALLTALKTNYTFYKQTCLSATSVGASCDQPSSSQLLGLMPCAPEDAGVEADCVYSEVRFCLSNSCNPAPNRETIAWKGGFHTGPFFEFSRFHGPLALYETSANRHGVMGQCEEFSRAAHALLSSLGFETRYVLDFTDHVWVEVRMPRGENGVWLHADPSEGVIDEPLMYEKGWNKKLTMIFAFTPGFVEHITSRYTTDYEATIQRRGIDEAALEKVLSSTNHRLRYEMPVQQFGFQSSSNGDALQPRSFEHIALWRHFAA